MIQQSKGKIFLADERDKIESDLFRSLNTFNFGESVRLHKEPPGRLGALSENVLAAGGSQKWIVDEETAVILLPIAGTIETKHDGDTGWLLQPGEAMQLHLTAGSSYEIINPYHDDLIKYLQVWIRPDTGSSAVADLVQFKPEHYRMQELFCCSTDQAISHSCAVIKLRGRQSYVYKLKNNLNGLFLYGIQGVLEAQYRLMYEGDGLALWDVDEAEFEALSNDAILLIIETAFS